jgi:hypothetical protein
MSQNYFMVDANLYEIFVPWGTKVEEQEDNTLRDVKVSPLFVNH